MAVAVAVGRGVAVAIGDATAAGAATISCNGASAFMTVPSARRACIVTA